MVSTRCLKYFCIVYNILFLVSGIFLLVSSGVLLYKLCIYLEFVSFKHLHPLYSLIGVSFIIFIGLWLGWKGVTREHRPHVIMFMMLVVVIICLEIGIGIWDLVGYFTFENETEELMVESFQKFVKNETNISRGWSNIQQDLRCCGLNGPAGYHTTLPTSCCIIDTGPQSDYQGSCPGIYQKGCLKPMKAYIATQLIVIFSLCFLIAIIQVCGVFCNYAYQRALFNDLRRRSTIATISEQVPLNRRHSSMVPKGTTS